MDDQLSMRVSAELMTLDAEGDDAVTLRIDSGQGSLAVALTVMDVVELLGVPVRALGMGQLGAAAIGVLAVCSHRAALPSTRFTLREPTTQAEVHARNVAQWAELHAGERERFCARVAAAVGQPASVVAADMASGRFLGAPEAMTYGLLDEICGPEAEIHHMPGPPIGFRPRR
jgi:ATP-dependent Clp protease protease subunit